MAKTTFTGIVRSENGFSDITKAAATGAITTNSTFSNNTVSYTHLTLPTKRIV